MRETLKPIKIEKDWVQVLEDEGIVTFNKPARIHYSYGDKEPDENFNRARDIRELPNYQGTKLWIRSASSEIYFAVPNVNVCEIDSKDKKIESESNDKKTNKDTKNGKTQTK